MTVVFNTGATIHMSNRYIVYPFALPTKKSTANPQTGRTFRENRRSRPVLPLAGCSLLVLAGVLVWPVVARAQSCPRGFYDPRNSGECWECPDGFSRTLAPVTANNACQVVRSSTFTHASRQGREGCAPGDIPDMIRGGKCWRCPPGLVRTIFPVDRPDACGRPGGVFDRKQPARFIKNVGCNGGEFPDLGWCWRCPSSSVRGTAHVESSQACVVPATTQFRPARFVSSVEACGGEGQPGCPIGSRRRVELAGPPCEGHLAEIGARCVKCGGEGQPGCPIGSRRRVELAGLPCEGHLAEIGARCVKCGGEGQPGCPVFSPRRVALRDRPCEQPFEEMSGRCRRPPETPCGGVGQRACCEGERPFGTCSAGSSTVPGCPFGAERCRCGSGSSVLAMHHCGAGCSAGTRWTVAPNAGCDTYKMGLATRDITGPIVDSQMQGYANGNQISKGLHTRLWARAFIVEGCNGKRVAFVSADMAQMFHSVRQGVVERLRQRFGDKYGFDNVVISATHTHAAIQGYTHYVWLNLSGAFDAPDHQGFDRDNFNAIVGGITDAIVAADQQANSTTGTIRIGAGAFDSKLSFNRSMAAYNLNPAAERVGQPEVDREMTLLRFDSSDGRELGSFNWLPVHNTTYSRDNPYVSGDAKGIAAYWLEKEKGVVEWGAQGGYVAGFAQAHCGDVSPNVPVQAGRPNPPTSATDSGHSRTIPNALAHLAAARSILAAASEQVNGSVEVINSFVDFEDVVVERAYSHKPLPTKTCEAWYGAVFQGGSKEDGEGAEDIKEGAQFTGIGFFGRFLPFVGPPAAVNSLCHQKELHPIVVLGKRADVHWSPTKLPLQIVVIGQFAIVAVPFEVTTMAGRRLKKSIMDALAPRVKHVVIAGLANDYAGYVTTREEHGAIHYEGASTQFGPDTEAALRQEFTALTCSLKGGSLASSKRWRKVSPPDLRNGNVVGRSNPASLIFAKGSRAQPLMSRIQPDDFDAGRKLAAVVTQVKPRYTTGETVEFQYRGGHPRRSIRRLPTFFRIERQDDRDKNVWQLVATDTSPETRFVWIPTMVKKPSVGRGPQYHSQLRIEWKLSIPNSGYTAKPGIYRLRFFGHTDTGRGLERYGGTSNEFLISD
jgi:neutral ceramidase